jgi:phospholipase C
MTDQRRREFLRSAGAGLALAGLPFSIHKALAIPAARVTGTLADVQHVVVLMQENRAFDHYFGTFKGVRGFGDRITMPLAGGRPVWAQSDGTSDILPFHLDTTASSAMRVPGTPHTWPDAQQAWDLGRMNQWPRYKQFQSMGYYKQADLPFQFALADAFTLCDAHHCSLQGGTLPNRVVFITGTNVTPGRTQPATDQSQALIDNVNNRGAKNGLYGWPTYPERLTAGGVSWRIYQDTQRNWDGLLAPWESFAQYKDAAPGTPLYENAMRDWSLDDLRRHVGDGTLPQVSWIIPTPQWSEHPGESSPFQGAGYIQQVLDILTANPAIWSKTAFIVSFDENDGFFDHVPPPALPAYNPDGTLAGATTLDEVLGGHYYTSTIGELTATRPFGLGPRVPLYVVSPWSKGGWINSQLFDHTSVIRFLEKRFGVAEPNIPAWHRAVSGDLTSCFDFAHPDDAALPLLPDMSAATGERLIISGLPPVALPAAAQMPVQEAGARLSRALPYDLGVDASPDVAQARIGLRFANRGKVGSVLHVYDRLHLDRVPRRYTVEAGKFLADGWSVDADGGAYDLWVLGPNGFLRHFRGALSATVAALPEVSARHDAGRGELVLQIANSGTRPAQLSLTANAYRSDGPWILTVKPGQTVRHRWSLKDSYNWYDFTIAGSTANFERRFAGRVETGKDGVTDPAMAMV